MHTSRMLVLALAFATATSSFAGGMFFRQLPRTNDFRKAADAIGTRLRDEVISTGTFDIGAMVVVGAPARALSAKELSALNVDLAGNIAKLHQDTPPADLAKNTTVEPFSGTAVSRTGKYLASVYAYTPGNGESDRLTKTIYVLTGKAGVTAKNGTVITSRSRFYDTSTQSKKYFTQVAFYNADSGQALVLYMISGTM